MHSNRRPLSIFLFALWLMLLVIFSNMGLIFAADTEKDKYLAENEYIKYDWVTKEAYIPYAASAIFVQIMDISNPDDIIISIGRGWDSDTNSLKDVLSTSISASYYVLNNDTLTNSWDTCPNNIGNPSEIRTQWVEPNISNISEYYYDVNRDALELKYKLEEVLIDIGSGTNSYNLTVRWLWDKKTGVLLNNSILFENNDHRELNGYVEQYLSETSIWSLDTGGGIPGYSLEILIPTILVGMLFLVVKVKREKRRAIIQ